MQLGSEDYVNILKLDIGFSSYSSKTTPEEISSEILKLLPAYSFVISVILFIKCNDSSGNRLIS